MVDELIKTHYTVYLTKTYMIGKQAIEVPGIPKEGYWFYATEKIVSPIKSITLLKLPVTIIEDIIKMTKKHKHYRLFPVLENLSSPTGWAKLDIRKILVVMGERKEIGKAVGFLIYFSGRDAWIQAIWPTESKEKYENLDEVTVSNLLKKDFNEFLNQKAWKDVTLFVAP